MQQVGTIAAYLAEKLIATMPKINLPQLNLTVRKKQKIKNVAVFCLLFVFPTAIVYTGYQYVEGTGGFLNAVSNFGQLHLKQVNLTVGQKDKVAHRSEWRVNPEEIKAVLSVKLGDPILDIDPEKIRQLISNVPWVKSASVKIILPSTLSITLEERIPFALWQRDEMFYLIDDTGAEITNQNLERYNYLPWVVGYGANTRIYEYAALMNDYADIFKHVKSAYRVSNRRWTLVTHNDMEISLSENNPRASLEQLSRLQKLRNILQQDIAAIDLRTMGKTFVRPKNASTLSVYRAGQNT